MIAERRFRGIRDGPVRDLNVIPIFALVRFAISTRHSSAVVLLTAALCLFSSTSAHGQHGQTPPAGGHGQTPPMSGPGPRGFGPGSTNPGAFGRGGAPVPGAAAQPSTAPRGPAQELKIDPTTLPEGFAPPSEKDPIMEIDRPLVPQDELNKLKQGLAKYQQALRKALSKDEDKALIRNGIRYRLALMCQRENRLELGKMREDFLRELNSAATTMDFPKADTAREFRRFVMQEVVTQASPLLETQNFHVRLQIAILLGELDLTDDTPKLGLKQEAFFQANVPLVKALNDPAQPEAIKVTVVNGLFRILRLGNPDVVARTNIANALVAALKNKKLHPWLQMRLVGALAAVDIQLDQQQKPFVVNALLEILNDPDPQRRWYVKAQAAKSLGRVPLPAAADPPSVTKAIAAFALKLAKAAQQDPQSQPDDPKWKNEFIKLYLAFMPLDGADLMADKKSKAGLLNNPAAQAKAAYDLIVPLVVAILQGQRLTAQQIQVLEAWVLQNPAPEIPQNGKTGSPKADDSPPPVASGNP